MTTRRFHHRSRASELARCPQRRPPTPGARLAALGICAALALASLTHAQENERSPAPTPPATTQNVASTGVPAEHPALERDARAWLDVVFDQLRGGPRRATLELTIEAADRRDTFVLEVVSDGADRSLLRVLEPARDAGQGFLVLGSDLLTYLPRVGRVLRLPPSGRSDGFLGSDLSYDDLAGDGLIDGADVTLAAASDDTITLRIVPAARAPTPYGALRMTARWPDLAPIQLTYEDQRGNDVKRLTSSQFVTGGDGRFVPTRFVVEDLTDRGGTTVASWTLEPTVGPPPASCFEPLALERGCSW